MRLLRRLKLAGLRAAVDSGVNSLILDSGWRQARLLILCYHGISLEDEHEWGPAMFLPPALFRERMETLRRLACTVLPLGEAVDRLAAGELPKRAVALTFDDGDYDFYSAAWPILREYGFPATVYLTTYYSEYNRPVFDVMVSYLLWKARGQTLVWPEVLRDPVLLDNTGRAVAERRIKAAVRQSETPAREKDRMLASLAHTLGLDYEAICARRLFHLMTLEEARQLAAEGVDIQLHTHRHRVSHERERFVQEIDDNRRRIACVSQRPAEHFCFPGGYHAPEFESFLRSAGVRSATTCEPGLADRNTNPYFLPRFLDTASTTAEEFAAILSGLASILPSRRLPASETQLHEYEPPGTEAARDALKQVR